MTAAIYRPDGKSQWVLEQLEFGPMNRSDPLDAAKIVGMERIRYVIAGLITNGMVTHAFNRDEITEAGLDALETLRDGHLVFHEHDGSPVIRANARVFERRAA